MKNQFTKTDYQVRHFSATIICVAFLLISILTFNCVIYRPMTVKAAPLKKYIKDVRVVTCTDANFNDESSELQKQGYTIDRNYNFADMDAGEDVLVDTTKKRAYLAYKTTHDYRNAITDLAFMNMKGPYSFSDYERLLEEQREVADNTASNLKLGLSLFRSNYAAKVPSAEYAYKMLNYFREDDSGKQMGDFLLEVDLSPSSIVLRNVVLEMETLILSLINRLVAIACVSIPEKDDWLTRFSSMDADDIFDQGGMSKNHLGAETLYKTMQMGKNEYLKYDKYLKEVQDTFGQDSYDKEDPSDVAKLDEITRQYFIDIADLSQVEPAYQVLATMPLSSDKYTYSPYGDFVEDHAGKGALINLFLDIDNLEVGIDDELYAMASVFTKEQLAMVYLAGIEPFITSVSSSEKDWDDIEKQVFDSIKYDYDNPNMAPPITSVYTGVDRSLFKAEGIALTDEAARRQFVDSEDVWYKGNMPYEAELALYITGGIAVAGMIGGAIYSYAKSGKMFSWYWTSPDPIVSKINKFSAQGRSIASIAKKTGRIAVLKNSPTSFKLFFRSMLYGDIKLCTANYIGGVVFGASLFLLMLAATVYCLVEYFQSLEKNYSTIPQVIVNNFSVEEKVVEIVDGKDKLVSKMKSIYSRYDAVLNQEGDFADVNIGGNEWIVPYISRDPKAGDPILFDVKIWRNKKESMPAGYSPMHRIGEESLYNGHANSSLNPLYVAYKRDFDAYPKTASTFSAGAFTLALCGGILGGGALGWLGTWLIVSKKRKNNMLQVEVQKTSGQDE